MTPSVLAVILKRIPLIGPNKYEPELDSVFELQTGLKVKFAIHPKSYKDFSNLLKDFDYYKGNTAEIVKNSSLVFLHSSTSLSYAVLFKKPVIFLTSNELKKSYIGDRIVNFSRAAGGKILNMNDNSNNNLDLKNLLNFDKDKYQEYKDKYLKFPNSPDIPLWEIFVKSLKDYIN